MFFNAIRTQISVGNTYRASLPNDVFVNINHNGYIPKRFQESTPNIWFEIKNEPGYIQETDYPEIYDGLKSKEQRSFGDLIRLSDTEYYRIDSISRDFKNLYLSKVKKSVEKFEIPLAAKSILSQYLKQAKREKKFILTDFWGTWCGPCIAAMPKLKEIEETYHQKLQVISICVDMKSKEDRANKILDSKGIKAERLFEHLKSSEGESVLTDAFDVHSFPTYILIKSNGEILLRGSGETTLNYVQKILE